MADTGNRMFCHSCEGVWSQNEGLTCPHCHSDFTEIVEIPPDPDTPPEDRRSSPSPPLNPWADHNPWAQEEFQDRRPFGFMDPGSTGYAHRTYRSPDGRFTFSSTTINGGGYSSRQSPGQSNPILPMMLQSFDAILREMTETYDPAAHRRGPGMEDPSDSSPRGGLGLDEDAGHEGLHPRNADRAQPMPPPVGSLTELLESFQADGAAQRRGPRRHGARGVQPHPLAMLSALLNVDQNGDAVYTQEAFDRVISEMMEQNGQGASTAPPPASRTAIRSLPKKKMDYDMLGTDGRAECSICMETAELGTEVTVLPCKHWFHFGCIELWLSQHNTCPHCRRSIDANGQDGGPAEGTSENPVIIQDSPEVTASGSRRRRSSPLSVRSWRSRSRSNPTSPAPEGDSNRRGSRESRGSRGDRGGLSGWISSRFGGSGSLAESPD